MRTRLTTYLEFVTFEHTVFSLPLIFAGAILAAQGLPAWYELLLILIAATAARTVALGLNRIIDRKIDRQNPRTQGRSLPAGKITTREAWMVVILALIVYEAAAAGLSMICVWLSPIPLLLFVGYPYLKRVTPWAHVGLGVTWSAAPLAGWIAVAGTFEQSTAVWILALFCCVWVAGFDIIYATQDEATDRAQHLRSLPVAFGRERAMDISLALHVAAFILLAWMYQLALRGGVSFGCLMFAGLLLLIAHVKRDEVEIAFFQVNAVIGFAVLGMVWAGVMST